MVSNQTCVQYREVVYLFTKCNVLKRHTNFYKVNIKVKQLIPIYMCHTLAA